MVLLENLGLEEGAMDIPTAEVEVGQPDQDVHSPPQEALLDGDYLPPPGTRPEHQGAVTLGDHQGIEGIGSEAQVGLGDGPGHLMTEGIEQGAGPFQVSGGGPDAMDQAEVELVEAAPGLRGELPEQPFQAGRIGFEGQAPTVEESRQPWHGRLKLWERTARSSSIAPQGSGQGRGPSPGEVVQGRGQAGGILALELQGDAEHQGQLGGGGLLG